MDFSNNTVCELREICKQNGIKKYSGKNKDEPIKLIEEYCICQEINEEKKEPVEEKKEPVEEKKEPVKHSLHEIYNKLVDLLTPNILVDIISKLHAITAEFTGDGAGLSGGVIVDKFIISYLREFIPDFKETHKGESDCTLFGLSLSIKKISGKSTIALDWSKNGKESIKRERFNTDMMIINLKTEQWWKKGPVGKKSASEKDINFLSTIKAGIYFISQTYCKLNIGLSSNNKSDSIIDNRSLYLMLKESIKDNLVIEFPNEFPNQTFNILNSFGK
jgi:hypothetical protein